MAINWELEHQKLVEANAKKIQYIYNTAVSEAGFIGASVNRFDPDRPFNFADYPQTKARIEALLKTMETQITAVIASGTTIAWDNANRRNNELVNSILGLGTRRGTTPGQLDLFAPPPEAENNPAIKALFNNNEQARDAFMKRKEDGLGLSDRVWKFTNQFKTEIEMGLDDGIRNGRPAAEIARDLRQFLQEPDRVYKRFQINLKDRDGNEVLDSQGNKIKIKQLRRQYKDPVTGAITWRVETPTYKPGRGVYRSSVKNSQRLTRTEINMAYRMSDHTRIQQLPFIVGFEVFLSNAHKVVDICDVLQGKYPKEFIYRGWHPHCFCPVRFILKTRDELKEDAQRILRGEPVTGESINQVTSVPHDFLNWVRDNKERIQTGPSVPYFIRDNYQGGNPTASLAFESQQAIAAARAAALKAEENARIQAAIRAEAERVLAAQAAEAARIAEEQRLADQRRREEIASWVQKGIRKIDEGATAGITGPVMDNLIAAVNSPNPTMETIRYRIVQMNIALRQRRKEIARIEAARIEEEARRAAEEAARILEEARRAEQARLEEEARRNSDPVLADWIRKGRVKIAEGRGFNITGPVMDLLVAAVEAPSPRWENIRYRIVQMNRAIAEARRTGRTSSEPDAVRSTTPQATQQRAARAAASGQTAARVITAETVPTRDMTEAELMQILRARLAANQNSGFDGSIMDWWREFTQGRNRLSGRVHREEIVRGINRMTEFSESLRTNTWTTVARENYKEPFKPVGVKKVVRESGFKFNMGAAEKNKLRAAGWKGVDELPSYEWNSLMTGFDMVKLDQEIMELANKYKIKIQTKHLKMSGGDFVFSVRNDESSEGRTFYLKRTFSMKDGKKNVEHDFLTIPNHLQNKNLTKELFESLYIQYKNAEVQRIHVHANISVGSYAWGRYGFTADLYHYGRLQKHAIVDIFEQSLRRGEGKESEIRTIIKYIKNRPDNEPIDMHYVSGMPGAKEALMNQHWYGNIDLENPERVRIFEEYLAKRK